MIGGAVLIIGLIVLLVVLLTKNDDKEVLGEIKCVFRVNDTSRIVYILSEDFLKSGQKSIPVEKCADSFQYDDNDNISHSNIISKIEEFGEVELFIGIPDNLLAIK